LKGVFLSPFIHRAMAVFLVARGRVQNVMFRQTVMRAAMSRGLVAGATNVKTEGDRVDITFEGDGAKIQEIVQGMTSGKKLNSWGARCSSVEMAAHGVPALQHEVNTSNVDKIDWVPGVEFYL
jgi:acylphosphatase